MSDLGPKVFDLTPGFHERDVLDMLSYASEFGVSDVKFYTGEPVMFTWRKKAYVASNRVMQNGEMSSLIKMLYRGDNADAEIGRGGDIDCRFGFDVSRDKSVGFRVNITACTCNGEDRAIRATLRCLPGVPPDLRTLQTPSEITRNLFPSHGGLVIIAGPTNSGKSTLLASGVRHALEHFHSKCFLTYEDPIEFTYDQVKKKAGNLIAQQEVGRDLKSFDLCGDNAMRSAPTDILVGESRSRVSLDSSMEFVLTGHTTYTTLHAQSVGMVFDRIIQKYPYEEQSGVTERLLASVTLIAIQRLLIRQDGKGLAPVNEWLHLDSDMKRKLSGLGAEKIGLAVDRLVRENQSSMSNYAAWLCAKEVISHDTACACSGTSAVAMDDLIAGSSANDVRFSPLDAEGFLTLDKGAH